MAKTPKDTGTKIHIKGGSGSFHSSGFGGDSSSAERDKFMKKIQEALEKQAADEIKAAEAQQAASEVQMEAAEKIEESAKKIEDTAETLSDAATDFKSSSSTQSAASRILMSLSTSLRGVFSSFNDSIRSFSESVQKMGSGGEEGGSSVPEKSLSKLDQIREDISSLLTVNKEILDAADAHGEVLYKILEAIINQESKGGGGSGGGGGGGRGPRGPAPPAGGGRGGPPQPRPLGTVGGTLAGAGAGAGSMMGGLGSMMGGAGSLLGGGAAMLLLGSMVDAKQIKENVETLLSIGEGYESRTDFLKDGGALTAALTGIGIGLAAFGAGQATVAIAQFISNDKWTETLKTNVANLLSISDSLGGNWEMLKDGAAFTLAMTGIGVGLGVFGVGQAAVGLAQFISSDDWAQKVLDNVTTLLSIADLKNATWGGVGTFIGVMGGLALGLAAFAIGQGAEVAADALDKTYQMFTGEKPFADRIYDNVVKLLSITDIEGIGKDTAGFVAVMLGISAGLAAFAFGKGANTVVDGADKALSYFSGEDPFADRIYNQVSKLLSITQIQTGDGKSFVGVMTDIVAGLTLFTAGNFADTLMSVGTRLVGFLAGKESPIDRIMQIADNATNLEKGADALQKVANALNSFASIKAGDLGNIDFEGLAKNLAKAIPLLQALSKGGVVGGNIFGFGSIDFGKGILDPELRLDEMASAISKINYVLGKTTSVEPTQVSTVPPTVGNQSAFNQASSSFSAMAQAGQPPVIVNNNTVNNAGGQGSGGGARIGGAISTAPSQSHIDRALYGWDDLHAATP